MFYVCIFECCCCCWILMVMLTAAACCGLLPDLLDYFVRSSLHTPVLVKSRRDDADDDQLLWGEQRVQTELGGRIGNDIVRTTVAQTIYTSV